MASTSIKARIINKHDKLEAWNNSTLPLKEGEVVLAKTTIDKNPVYIAKIGTKDATFADSPWLFAKASDVYAWAKQNSLPVEDITSYPSGANKNDYTAISSIIFEGNKIKYTKAKLATDVEFDALEARILELETTQITTEKIAEGAVSKNKLAEDLNLTIDMLVKKAFPEIPTSWEDVQQIVRAGEASTVFNIGDQFIVERANTVTASIGESTGITAATVNADTFVKACGKAHAGEYSFTYDGESWHNDSDSVIAIAEYGIELTGTPVAGDKVIVSETTTQLTFDIIGFDHDTPANSEYTHSMTLQLHDALSTDITESAWGIQFDAPEYTWYIDKEMVAGTYNFTLPAGYDTGYGGGATYQFTTMKDLPKGGVIRFDWKANTRAVDCKIETRTSNKATSVYESNISVTPGSEGTALPAFSRGTTNITAEKLATTNANALECSRSGCNVWATSNIRQWLNSKGDANSWWQPQTVFDKAPQYANKAGFLNGFDPEFLKAVGEVRKITEKNIAEGYGLAKSTERFFLLSKTEVYGGTEGNSGDASGAPYAYYSPPRSDLTAPGTGADSNRIKYINGVVKPWSLRTPTNYWVHNVGRIGTSGQGTDSSAVYASGISPACCIV